jgi:hypothetical protein
MDSSHGIAAIFLAHSLFASVKAPLRSKSAICFCVKFKTYFAARSPPKVDDGAVAARFPLPGSEDPLLNNLSAQISIN